MKDSTKAWVFFAENDIKVADSIINEARLAGQVIFIRNNLWKIF